MPYTELSALVSNAWAAAERMTNQALTVVPTGSNAYSLISCLGESTEMTIDIGRNDVRLVHEGTALKWFSVASALTWATTVY